MKSYKQNLWTIIIIFNQVLFLKKYYALSTYVNEIKQLAVQANHPPVRSKPNITVFLKWAKPDCITELFNFVRPNISAPPNQFNTFQWEQIPSLNVFND